MNLFAAADDGQELAATSTVPVRRKWLPGIIAMLALFFMLSAGATQAKDEVGGSRLSRLDEIEKRVNAYVPDIRFPDDPFILATLREAVAAVREGNGGIGACLVREATGEIVERGHNRQFEPHFRSDLHAEMDLITRYEERVRASRGGARGMPTGEQRKISGLVLYTSVEPCPMCLSRIVNLGIKKIYWAAADPEGGMGLKVRDLPPFWRNRASGQLFESARCSVELKQLAGRLFQHPMAQRQGK